MSPFKMYRKLKIHFVGIGGVGMSGIAEVLLNLGYPVSGSDMKPSQVTRRLKNRGAKIYYGHKGMHVGDAQVVVVSSAIKPDNPEMAEATIKHIPILARADMLAELMRFSRFGIAVAGTHGKTTTTSLIASVLHAGGTDPTMVIGGRVNNFRSNARLGSGEFMVAEADESDGSFLKLSPSIAVITNIDREHMDFYGTFGRVKKSYITFANKIPFYGSVICCTDHPVVRQIIPHITKRVVTYGMSEDATWNARNIRYERGRTIYDLYVNGELKDEITLNLLGEHNVKNSLATLAVAGELLIPLKKSKKALSGFKGIHRRLETLFQNKDFTVLDDYGHHPVEIKATLSAIRGAYTGRIVTLFQPHRYSRTQDMFKDFTKAFSKTDELLVTDIYAAGESPLDGVHSKKLAAAIGKKTKKMVTYVPKDKNLVDHVVKFIKPGDVLLSLGAGDVTKMGRECAKRIKKSVAA